MQVQRVQGYGVGFQSRQIDRRALPTDTLLKVIDDAEQKGRLVVTDILKDTGRELYKIFDGTRQVAEYTEAVARA